MKRIISITVLVLFTAVAFCQASTCCGASQKKEKAPPAKPLSETDEILLKLNTQNAKLKFYQAKIDYLFQDYPEEMPESGITRTGDIYYKKDIIWKR